MSDDHRARLHDGALLGELHFGAVEVVLVEVEPRDGDDLPLLALRLSRKSVLLGPARWRELLCAIADAGREMGWSAPRGVLDIIGERGGAGALSTRSTSSRSPVQLTREPARPRAPGAPRGRTAP